MNTYFTDIEDGDTALITETATGLTATSCHGTTEPVTRDYIDTYMRPSTADEITTFSAVEDI